MRIGIDFDNTIVCYDQIFHAAAAERELIPAETPKSKQAVRDYLRRSGKEAEWIELQGYVYGVKLAEAEAFPGLTEFMKEFAKLNTEVIGISRDSLSSHEKFRSKYDFSFDLISDEDEVICNAFDVIKEKNMYGKKYMGIERSTFLIDENNKLIAEWRKVKAKGHAQSILDYIADL